MSATPHPARPLPAPLGAMPVEALSPHDAAALAAYEALSAPERVRACRLIAVTGCSLRLALSAIVATRQPTEE